MDKDYVTPEQIEKARAVNLLDYLQRYEPSNLTSSAPGEYKLKDHDSLKISNGKFHWFSRGIGGTNAIDYLVKVRGVEFKEAVRELAGDVPAVAYSANPSEKHATLEKPMQQAVGQQDNGRFFVLPDANIHNNDVIEYLKGRGIEENILNGCIENGLLYQNKNQGCVFVGYDNEKTPKFACERGTRSDYKKDVYGSNKAFNFCLPPKANDFNDKGDNNGTDDRNIHPISHNLYVFEGAVDCLSHAAISQIGDTGWDGYRLSLGGVSGLALNTFLENNPQVNTVYLCLDNDKPGKEATGRISREMLANEKYSHISIYIAPPPVGKDYNDTLVSMQEKIKEKIKEKKLQTENIAAVDTEKSSPSKKHIGTAL